MEWLKQCNFEHIRPILTPRFIPTCSDALMTAIGKIKKETHLPLQSHLSENPIEIQFVQELVPESKFYGDAYDLFGTFGTNGNTVMAHCVYSDDEKIARMKKNGVYVAHCAKSNFNLSSGIAPARKFMNAELNMGLGTDIGAGSSISMFRAIKEAIVASKMYWRLVASSMAPLRVEEAFYLATAGGGSFFGKVGSFEDGYDFDAVIVNDEKIYKPVPEKLENRLERVIMQTTAIPSLTNISAANESLCNIRNAATDLNKRAAEKCFLRNLKLLIYIFLQLLLPIFKNTYL